MAIPTAELQAAVDAAQPPSPRQGTSSRGRRLGGTSTPDERRPSGVPGGPSEPRSTSGQTSMKSSTAPSPLRPQVSQLPGGHVPSGPPVNHPQPFRPITNHLNMPTSYAPPPGSGQRSHPHSPMNRSPYLLSQSNTRQSSPRLGGGHYSPNPQYRQMQQPQQALRHPLPPNPHAVQQPLPPPKKKVPKLSPAKSQAVGGDIPALPLPENAPKPIFGSLEPEGGLGLSVNGDGRPATLSNLNTVDLPEETGIVRWHERHRTETEAELLLKKLGKFGIGVDASSQPKTETKDDKAGDAKDETERVEPERTEDAAPSGDQPVQDASSMEPMKSPKHKWSFGSFDGAGSPIRSRFPSSGDGTAESSGINGYGYGRGTGGSPPGHRGYGDDRRGDQYGYSYDGNGGYGGRQMNGRRGGRGRGGAGGYGPRGGYQPRGQPGGPYRGGGYPSPVPPPIITGYSPIHPSQAQYDPSLQVVYPPPPMPAMDYQDPYGPPSAVPPTPGGSHPPPMSATDGPYTPHPQQPQYPPYMYGPPPTSGYYPPYPYMVPYMPPMPVGYAPTPFPPPPTSAPGTSTPPMPMPLTNPGYTLDPNRFYLLGQVSIKHHFRLTLLAYSPLTSQVEYYFSVQNFLSDLFLRKQVRSPSLSLWDMGSWAYIASRTFRWTKRGGSTSTSSPTSLACAGLLLTPHSYERSCISAHISSCLQEATSVEWRIANGSRSFFLEQPLTPLPRCSSLKLKPWIPKLSTQRTRRHSTARRSLPMANTTRQ